jgi:uncharacterized protein YbbC (DUF1343 family)
MADLCNVADLTKYQLQCGYIQKATTPEGREVQLYYEADNTFVVRQCLQDHEDIKTSGNHRYIVWDLFHTLTAARKRFRQLKKKNFNEVM